MIAAATRRPLVGSVGLWLVALITAVVAVDFLDQILSTRRFGFDFVPSFWGPWHAIRSGLNPYPDPAAPFAGGNPFLYPPLAAELTLPLSWLPFGTAAAIFTATLVLAAGLTLWALDVRHPALWVIWMFSAPVIGAVAAGNASLLVTLAVALTWRWRDRPVVAATTLTAALVLKLFVWPVWLWLLFTRRYRAGIYTAGATLGLVLASWAVIDFRGMTDFPALLGNVREALGMRGMLAYALVAKTGSPTLALVAGLCVATLLLWAAYVRRDDDRAAMTFAILAALYATPILWLHYFALLVIPVALYGGWLWLTMPLLALPRLATAGVARPAWMIVTFIAITGAVAAKAVSGDWPSSQFKRLARGAREGTA